MKLEFDGFPNQEKYPSLQYRHLLYLQGLGKSKSEIRNRLCLEEEDKIIQEWLNVYFEELNANLCKAYKNSLTYDDVDYHQLVSIIERELDDINGDDKFEFDNESIN